MSDFNPLQTDNALPMKNNTVLRPNDERVGGCLGARRH
jgi:hypothetical protein